MLHSGLALLSHPSFAELLSFVVLHDPSSICRNTVKPNSIQLREACLVRTAAAAAAPSRLVTATFHHPRMLLIASVQPHVATSFEAAV